MVKSENKPRLALDIDDVVFSFTEHYSTWRTKQGLVSFDPTRLTSYEFPRTPGINDETTIFLCDAHTLALLPSEGASEGVRLLAQKYEIIPMTNRYDGTQKEPT